MSGRLGRGACLLVGAWLLVRLSLVPIEGARAQASQEVAVIAFFDNGTLSIVNRDGSAERAVAHTRLEIPSWSPDGKLLVVESEGLALLSVEDGSIRTIAPGLASGASFSPDGKWIVYSTGLEKPILRVVGVDGSGARTLYDDPVCPAVFPLWSPAGDWIAFAHQGNSPCRGTASIRPDGTGYRLLDSDSNGRATWSPSGRDIAISTYPGVTLVSPDGSNRRAIHAEVRAWNPDWSRDDRLVFPVWDGTQADLYTSKSDGSPMERLTDSPDRNEDWVSWSPDGKSIAFATSPLSGNSDQVIAVLDVATRTSRELARRQRAYYPMFRPVLGPIHRTAPTPTPTSPSPSPSPSPSNQEVPSEPARVPLAVSPQPTAGAGVRPHRGSPMPTTAPRAGSADGTVVSEAPPVPAITGASDVGGASDEAVAALAAQPPAPERGPADVVDTESSAANSSSPAGWVLASAAFALVVVGSSLGVRRQRRRRRNRPFADFQ